VKYTVPPATLFPLPFVGSVNPGPLAGPAAATLLPPLDEPDDDEPDDPHAAANSAISPTPINATTHRLILRIDFPPPGPMARRPIQRDPLSRRSLALPAESRLTVRYVPLPYCRLGRKTLSNKQS
jgi:hypothetical protein